MTVKLTFLAARAHQVLICVVYLSPFLCGEATLAESSPRFGTVPALYSSEELRRTLANLHPGLYAWYIEYESLPTNDRMSRMPRGGYFHRTVAAKVPDKYYHWSTKGTLAFNWRNDPLQQRFTINAVSAINEYSGSRSFYVVPLAADKPLPGTAPQEMLFAVLGWWPFAKRPAPLLVDGSPCVLRDVARSLNYAVSPLQEKVDGRWCHVLEFPGHDRLWLDCGRNCAIVAREMFDPKTGVCLQRIESSGHWEVASGIWVPTEFRSILFDGTAPSGVRRKVADVLFHVLCIKLNDEVDDTLFTFVPRPGSIQIFDDGRFEQKVAGGMEYLDEMADFLRPRIRSLGTRAGAVGTSAEAIIEYILSVSSLMTIIIVRWRHQKPIVPQRK